MRWIRQFLVTISKCPFHWSLCMPTHYYTSVNCGFWLHFIAYCLRRRKFLTDTQSITTLRISSGYLNRYQAHAYKMLPSSNNLFFNVYTNVLILILKPVWGNLVMILEDKVSRVEINQSREISRGPGRDEILWFCKQSICRMNSTYKHPSVIAKTWYRGRLIEIRILCHFISHMRHASIWTVQVRDINK